MGKKLLSLFQKRLFPFTAISLLLITGCLDRSEQRANPVSSQNAFNGNSFYTASDIQHPKFFPSLKVPLPDGISGRELSIFAGDCRGDKNAEIILASEDSIMLYDLDGNFLMQKDLEGKSFHPAFIEDMDGDSKVDIVFGTTSAGTNQIRIINGMGNVISNFREENTSQDFSTLIPIGTYNDHLFAIAQPADVKSPRGILRFNKYSLKLNYTFFTPYPTDLTLVEQNLKKKPALIIPSYHTFDEGVFLEYGKSGQTRKADHEVKGVLLKIDLDGKPAGEHEIFNKHNHAMGTLEYHAVPGGSEELILIHYASEKQERAPCMQLFKIALDTGRIMLRSSLHGITYIDSRFLPISDDYLIACVIQNETGKALHFYSSNFELLNSIPLNDTFRFTQAFLDRGHKGFHLFFILRDGIYKVDKNLESENIINGNGYLDLKFFESKNQTYAVLLAEDGFEIYQIRE